MTTARISSPSHSHHKTQHAEDQAERRGRRDSPARTRGRSQGNGSGQSNAAPWRDGSGQPSRSGQMTPQEPLVAQVRLPSFRTRHLKRSWVRYRERSCGVPVILTTSALFFFGQVNTLTLPRALRECVTPSGAFQHIRRTVYVFSRSDAAAERPFQTKR